VRDEGQILTPEQARALRDAWPVPLMFQVAALGLWLMALPLINVDSFTDLGLGAQLPLLAYAAIALAVTGFGFALAAPTLRPPVLATAILLMTFMIYGVSAMIEDAPRFAVTYLHVGFAEAIGRTGELFPNRDARFDWPAFFALLAFIGRSSGLDLLGISPWIPVISNLLYLGPIWVIVRSLTLDARLAWLSLAVFVSANWIGQDYLSPQGFAYLLYLVVLAILVRWFRIRRPGWPDRIGAAVFRGLTRLTRVRRRWRGEALPLRFAGDLAQPETRPGLVVVLGILTTAIVAGHQLTPFVLFGAAAGLVFLQRSWLRGYPLVVGVILAGWLSYMSVTYLAGHLPGLVADLGRAGDVASETVEGRLYGSPGHRAIVYFRLVFSLVFWLGAAVGALRRLGFGRFDLALGLLAALPFGLLGLQSYGGEIILRIYLFTVPFMAFFVASALRPFRSRVGGAMVARIAVVLFALTVGCTWARYGNERADRISAAELAAVREVYEIVPPGSRLVSANYNSPVGYRQWEQFDYASVGPDLVPAGLVGIRRDLTIGDPEASYLLITNSMRATSEMFGGTAPGGWDEIVAQIRSAPFLELVLDRPGAVLFRYVGGPT
jgi:hypothetical protein